jgi:hypothetical protein
VKRVLVMIYLTSLLTMPVYSQSANKLRVIAAPGVTKSDAKDWKNTLAVSGTELTLNCPKCMPIQDVATPISQVASLRYGQNAYHHWVSGIVTGAFSLGIGLIVGLMPHHQHYFSIDLKDGKVIGIQADKGDYRQIAGMLQNSISLPIQVSAKDAHYLNGFNTKIVATDPK